jgi:hypothetical protein
MSKDKLKPTVEAVETEYNNPELYDNLTTDIVNFKPISTQPTLTALELAIIAKSATLNEPALCAYFNITHDEVKAALKKK